MSWKPSSPGNDLKEGQAHVWRVGLQLSDPALGRLRGVLSEDEVVRSERLRFPELRRRFVAGRGALRTILAGYLSIEPEKLEFGYAAHGKPFLLNAPYGIQFNLSHSGSLMVVGVCLPWPIGVDIEREEARFRAMEIAERHFCDREKEEIAHCDGETARLQAFLQIWTAKEALLKATSVGLSLELSSVEIGLNPLRVMALQDESGNALTRWHLIGFRPAANYWGSLATAEPPSQIEWRELVLSP
jgi:4'-phosphopantetheinyl transferase